MRRRDFIVMLGAGAWSLTARAQQTGRLPTIGFLGAATATVWAPWSAAFAKRLNELGWTEGRTVVIEYRWAEGRSTRFAEIATEFVQLNVDAIVTAGSEPTLAAKQVTTGIPIIFAGVVDPIAVRLVASLARPGGNVTGLSLQSSDVAGKRLELLREVLPNLRKLAILFNIGNPGALLEMSETEAAARTLGLDVAKLEIRRAEDIAPAFEGIKGPADALYVGADPLVNANRVRIHTLSLSAQLPTVYGLRGYVEVGGCMSYGASITDEFRRAAEIVDKILHGAKPADIPVEQPTKFELVINLKTAKALGLEMPPMLLARADEVIE
ncbi:MAG TPA: ABC transporter substrate-binding protein [Stellaceae bacterium]|nr:ABC transporter substrate-binding protein [Stellaceae bacterium]